MVRARNKVKSNEVRDFDVFDNPAGHDASVEMEEGGHGPDGTPDPQAEPLAEADPLYYLREPMDRSLAWLIRREERQAAKVIDQRVNCHPDFDTGEDADLGPITLSWCFSFKMAHPKHEDDLSASERQFTMENFVEDKMLGLEERASSAALLPYECWQFCHMLWKSNFHVAHQFSPLDDHIYILLGLPYKTLLEEAVVARLATRLDKTVGTTVFDERILPRMKTPYHVSQDVGVFSSCPRPPGAVKRH
jgi:hypothetical protein